MKNHTLPCTLLSLLSTSKAFLTVVLVLVAIIFGVPSLHSQSGSCSTSSTCPVTNIVLDTGVDYQNGNARLPIGAVDPNWTISHPYLGPSSLTTVVVEPDPNWGSSPGWIGLQQDDGANELLGIPYTFKRCLKLCSGTASIPIIAFAASHQFTALRVNGVNIPISVFGNSPTFGTRISNHPAMQNMVPDQNGEICIEVDVVQYSSSMPVGLELGGLITGNFAEEGGSTIRGTKYNDRNANGVQDFGDSYLPGWEMKLTDNATGQVVRTTLTDAFGQYEFNHLPAGNYTVTELNQAGWTIITPSGGSQQITLAICDLQTVDFVNHNGTGVPPANDCGAIDPGCATNLINLTTGMDHTAGTPLANGAVDARWKLINVPTGSFITAGESPIVQAPTSIIDWNGEGSTLPAIGQWLTVSANTFDNLADTDCLYTYQRCFSTCETGNVTLDFNVFADTHLEEIRLDGQVLATFPYPAADPLAFMRDGVAINLSETLAGGEHCLEFDVRNHIDFGIFLTETGFKLEGIVSGAKLVGEACSFRHTCRIPVGTTMFQTGAAVSLADEQSTFMVGDPLNGVLGAPASAWQIPWPGTSATDVLDLGQPYQISTVFLYQGSDNGFFQLEYFDAPTAQWLPLFIQAMNQNHLITTNITTQHLRCTTYDGTGPGGNVNEMVLYGAPDYLNSSYQIPLTASMITNVSGVGDPTKLVDEQTANGNPFICSGTNQLPTSDWEYTCWSGPCPPIVAELDLERLYHLNALAFFDGAGVQRFIIEYEDNGSWVTLFDGPLDQYDNWRGLHQLDIYTSKLRFTHASPGAAINEILLYGKVTDCPPSNSGNSSLQAIIPSELESAAPVNESVALDESTVEIFPNPSSGALSVVLPASFGPSCQISLYAITGQRVWTQKVETASERVDLSIHHLPSGTYYLQLTSEMGQIIEKLIKQ